MDRSIIFEGAERFSNWLWRYIALVFEPWKQKPLKPFWPNPSEKDLVWELWTFVQVSHVLKIPGLSVRPSTKKPICVTDFYLGEFFTFQKKKKKLGSTPLPFVKLSGRASFNEVSHGTKNKSELNKIEEQNCLSQLFSNYYWT